MRTPPTRRLAWLSELARDLRHGFRTLRRNPLFTAVAVMTLALGIGANTAIFSLADAVLFRTLPVSQPHELVMLRQRGPAGDAYPFTSAAAAALGEGRDALSGLAAFRPVQGTHVAVAGEVELAQSQMVSGNYHAVLGVRAVLGRTLTEHDREPVAVISHRFWLRRFGGDPNVAGGAIDVQGRSFTIVGVTPREFFGTQPGRHVDITTPLAAATTTMPPNARWLYLVGRLAPGVSRDQARAALRVRWQPHAAAPASAARPPDVLEVDSGAQGMNQLRREFSLPLRILMAAVGIVLFVACANLAGLLLVKSSARQREIAVRRSLGATGGRVVRQLLTESALLAAAGGAAGVAVAYWLTGALLAMMSRGRGAILIDVSPNPRSLAFAAAVTCAAALLFGLLPALGASRTDVQPALKRGSGGSDGIGIRWGRAMVATQIALLVVLLASAGLFTRTLRALRDVDPGFRPEQVLLVNVSRGPGYPGAKARALSDELSTRFAALPGVHAVSLAMDPPTAELSMCGGISRPDRPSDRVDETTVCWNFVGPRFFQTMSIPLLAGRDIEPGDDPRAPQRVAIGESVARRFFPSEDPIGQQIVVGGAGRGRDVTATIIAVVKDVRYTSLRTSAPLVVYRPARQDDESPADTLLVRASAAAAGSLRPLLRAEVRAAAPSLPPPSIVTLDDRMASMLVEERMLSTLSSALGGLAALLAAIGIYSTVASAVARRQREIGIRMALGALPGEVSRLVVTDAFRTVAIGLFLGIPAALAAGYAARAMLAGVLFGLAATDPLNLSRAAIAIVAVALLAAYLPARRATRIDPAAAVRYE